DWQLANDAAMNYLTVLVPAILGPFAEALVEWADIDAGMIVVDVGCGTGAATRFAAKKAGKDGTVIGTDVNRAMIAVAESLPQVDGAQIVYRQESADALSADSNSVDAVFCAQALQFMKAKQVALAEMHRVLKTDSKVYVSLWCAIDESPYFDALVNTIAKHISDDTAAGLRSAFQWSDLEEITKTIEDAGFTQVDSTISTLNLRFTGFRAFVPHHIRATPMSKGFDAVNEVIQSTIVEEMVSLLDAYIVDDVCTVPFRSYLISGTK
ncbi:MAG: class I SAM-dependent methyltransferase, partial [Chloroflexota bacterium]